MVSASSKCSYSKVVAGNNLAVQEVLRGNVNAASIGIRDCFLMVKQSLAVESQQCSDELSSSTCVSVQQPQGETVLKLTASPTALPGLQNQDFFVYNRPILLQHEVGVSDPDPVATVQLLSTVVIFNQAILCHFKARCTKKSKENVKAQKLYLSVVKLGDIQSDLSQLAEAATPAAWKHIKYVSRWKMELSLAAVNNYAELCQEINDHNSAEQVARAVHSNLSNISQPRAFSSYEWDRLLSNILFLSLAKTCWGVSQPLVLVPPRKTDMISFCWCRLERQMRYHYMNITTNNCPLYTI